jgi:putative hydrolase of the HAD superfamily
MRPRAVFFDLDDTLIDRASAFERYLADFMGRFPAAFPSSRWVADLAELHALDRRGATDRATFCRRVTATFPGVGLTPEAFWEDMSSRLPLLVRRDDDVCRLVELVTKRQPVAAVSNGSGRVQRAKLKCAALTEQLPHVFISGEVGAEKPDPRIFQAALAAVDRTPQEVLHVGDDPERDIAAAARLGMATCWISHGRDWPHRLPPPTFTVGSVFEDPEALREVLSRWT